jgi:hypothetical protein
MTKMYYLLCRFLDQILHKQALFLFSLHHYPVGLSNKSTPYFFLNNQPDALVSFMQVFDDCVPSWLCLEAVIKNLHETYQCRMYSRKLLMMGREDARNM